MNSKEQNQADHESARPSQGSTEPSDKLGKHMSASYKEAYGQKADPSMGTRVMAGKNRGEEDTLHGGMKKESVQDAKATPGACKKAIDKQCGKHYDNMNQTKAGNAPDEDLQY